MPAHELVVIGAGPGGYVAALRAAQLGMDVACVDNNPVLGGTCLRVGCIPSKALLESSEQFHRAKSELKVHGVVCKQVELDLDKLLARKDRVVTTLTKGVASLFKKAKITHYQGHGKLAGSGKVTVTGEAGATQLEAKHILIATGSKPANLPGVELDGDRVGTSTEALSYSSVPEHLVVIGAGYIGMELGSVWLRLGAKVTMLEYLDHILPGSDRELANEAIKLFNKQGLAFHLGTKDFAARATDQGAVVESEGNDPVECDRVLLAVGRVPCTVNLGLKELGIEVDRRGTIQVDDHFATSAAGVYAIGDCIRGPMLAHKAEEEGIACVERLATGYGHVNYDVIPAVVYTEPELASVGRTEEQLKQDGVQYKKGLFPFRANGRALSLADTNGQVKILADAQTDRILGVHILGSRAGDLIAEAAAAMEFGASAEDLARTCHAHPTLSEAVKEAALAVDGRALHIPK